ncbi:MAG: hypothetical protein JW750_05830 [Anaerolineaceae bacterium]|nr:hypothetical protein [Anaerolineaceae bacterium]
MINWIPYLNLLLMAAASLLYLYFYQRSVSPFMRQQLIGNEAYKLCGRERVVSGIMMIIVIITYALYPAHPIPLPVPNEFAFPYSINLILSGLIGLPVSYLVVRGMRDAGKEAVAPREDTILYGGIYQHIRHPQAYEVFYWFIFALLFDSPFLLVISLLHIPLEMMMIEAEERDLVFRFGEDYVNYMRTTGKYWVKPHRRES